jgi:succinate dehydrogenase / fumarate reductase cytochrome b subunit
VKYAVMKVNETSSWFSRNMGITGSIILFFIVVHLKQFFWPYRITGLEMGDTVANSVAVAFANPWYSLLYIVSVLFLAFHLNHGFQSAFQTVGLNNKKYAKTWKMAGTGFAALIAIGFGSFPVIFYIGQKIGWDVLNWAK